jgi:hypothetical protein
MSTNPATANLHHRRALNPSTENTPNPGNANLQIGVGRNPKLNHRNAYRAATVRERAPSKPAITRAKLQLKAAFSQPQIKSFTASRPNPLRTFATLSAFARNRPLSLVPPAREGAPQ